MALERKPTGAYDAAYPLSTPSGGTAYAQAAVLLDASGNAASIGSKQESFTLANNVSAAGDYPNGTPNNTVFGQVVYGGDYVWSVLGTIGSGGSVQLKSVIRNANGVVIGTQNIGAAKTAADTNGGTGIGLGSNAEVFVTIAGSNNNGVYVQLSRLP